MKRILCYESWDLQRERARRVRLRDRNTTLVLAATLALGLWLLWKEVVG